MVVVECAFTALLLMSTMVVPVPAALHCIASLAFMMVFCFSSFFLFSRRSQAHPHFVSPRFDPDISFGIKHYAGQMSSTALCILSVGLPACLRMRGDPVAMICKCLHYTQLPACSPCTFTLTCRGVSCLVLSWLILSRLVSPWLLSCISFLPPPRRRVLLGGQIQPEEPGEPDGRHEGPRGQLHQRPRLGCKCCRVGVEYRSYSQHDQTMQIFSFKPR